MRCECWNSRRGEAGLECGKKLSRIRQEEIHSSEQKSLRRHRAHRTYYSRGTPGTVYPRPLNHYTPSLDPGSSSVIQGRGCRCLAGIRYSQCDVIHLFLLEIANEIVPMFPLHIPELQDSWNTTTPRGGDSSCKAGEAGGVENTRLGVPTPSSFGLGVM